MTWLKDGQCPKCGGHTSGRNYEPMYCRNCGWHEECRQDEKIGAIHCCTHFDDGGDCCRDAEARAVSGGRYKRCCKYCADAYAAKKCPKRCAWTEVRDERKSKT